MDTRALAAEGAGVVTDATSVQLSTIVVKYLANVASWMTERSAMKPQPQRGHYVACTSCHMHLLG